MLKLTLYIGHADGTARPIEIARIADKAFAVVVLGRLEGAFDTMATIERYINELAACAAKF